MVVHIPIKMAQSKQNDWGWLDADGNAVLLHEWVRVARIITRVPTAYPSVHKTDAGMRFIDYGRVVELLPNGRVSVEWKRAGEYKDEPADEDSNHLEVSTAEAAEAFELGLDLGYENGFRAGAMVQMNEQREVLGLRRLTDEEFDTIRIDGVPPTDNE